MSLGTVTASSEARTSLQVHPDDNVATLLDNVVDCTLLADGMTIAAGIPFGHKVALRRMEVGSAVVKYGVTIGTATHVIHPGEHVHVHNVV
ncbi:UxaA family hydrolase [Granulosicoccus sp. 3-233]|uniref:UxaA family hydrolase n=1 Tax=Granulosicoccus sp. 3-233 TaxID=3417969 RepID=UPI003D340AE1